MARGADLLAPLLAAAVWGGAATPAAAQAVCLDCFTELLGANPFAAPLVLPGQLLVTGTLGLAPPLDFPTLLPNVLAKAGLRDGLEAVGTLGYEPALGLRGRLSGQEGLTVLGAGRVGYAYFRQEWLAQASLPTLWSPRPGWAFRVEPQVTLNAFTGNHLVLELAASFAVAPGTAVMAVLAPDYRVAVEQWTGAASLGLSRSLSPRWATYALASVYVLDQVNPLVAAGLTYTPPPLD